MRGTVGNPIERCVLTAVAAVLALAFLVSSPVLGKEISGSRSYAGEVVVPKGETWKVLPGAVLRFRGGKWIVRGKLLIEGTASLPVRIVGDDAFEGLDIRGESGSVVADVILSGGTRGVQLTSAEAVFRKVRWERNGVGLDVGQYAKAAVDNCTFESPFRVGILVKRGGAAEVAGCRFTGAGKAGIYVYGAKDVSVKECRFESNATGLQAAMSGVRVSVRECVFRGNGIGILAERMAEPKIDGCDFSGNRVGLLFSRRSEGSVSGSRIAENGDGVVVEFSSYPVFHGNRFRENRDAAVRLRHQSSQWEEELGDAGRDSPERTPFGAGPEGRKDFRPGGEGTIPRPQAGAPGRPPGKKGDLTGTVDFRGNDWGELAGEVAKGGEVAAIHDGRAEPEFEYKGKRYRMDRVLLR
ncbi:MAG: right-handed parallel beta-helix repeat-containing protein [Deltaproteobacteria bacterium]|nr:right-handed parallel beta-helix repeat-containing protein [Deltaproteobacteria bacterium]